MAVIPAAHPLAGRAEVAADELRAERFVAMRAGYLMHRFAHRLFGSDPSAEWHCADGAELGKMMVAEGIGITLLPNYSVHGDYLERAGLIVARPIADDRTTVTLVALRRRQTRVTTIVRDMIAHLRHHANPSRARHAQPAPPSMILGQTDRILSTYDPRSWSPPWRTRRPVGHKT